VGLLGLAFKAGTDDLRESPLVEMVERLIGKGYDLKIYDPNVKLAALLGGNRDYILDHLPHISSLLVPSAADVIEHADTVLIGTTEPEFKDALGLVTDDQHVIDLVGLERPLRGSYDALCW
jgi:GDP-mannose 6-dehydrogenase